MQAERQDPGAQHMRALAQANEMRMFRAGVKTAIANGHLDVVDSIEVPATWTMAVWDLLACQPRWGRQRTARAMRAAGVADGAVVERLTRRQIAALGDAVGRPADEVGSASNPTD